jgi:hypothetical protein
MKKKRTSNHILQVLGLYQIIGGGFGLFTLIYGQIVYSQQITIISFGVFSIFSFSVAAGLLLLTKNNTKYIRLTLVNQSLQVVMIKLVGFGFQYVAGSYFAIGFSDTPRIFLQYKYAIIKSACFVWPGTDNEITVMINLVPILLIYISSRITYKAKNN